MKTIIPILSLLFLSATLTSFSNKSIDFTGTYGIANDSYTISITIAQDGSFHYVNSTNKNKPIDVQGQWETKGRSILLKDYQSPYSIHSKWKVDKDYPCLRSNFTNFHVIRLCKQEP